MRKVVYILLITATSEGMVQTGIGPVCWTKLDAELARRSLEKPHVTIQIEEREVRGDMPTLTVAAR